MFGRIGPTELILILAIALVVFGPKKLPEIGKAIGAAIRNFRAQSEKLTDDLNDTTQDQIKGSRSDHVSTSRPDDNDEPVQ